VTDLFDDPHLLHSIARRLALTADRNQVVEEICLLHNITWSQAEELVERALADHSADITRLQTPILAPLALALFIGGAALSAWQLLGITAVLSALLNPRAESFWDVYNLSFGFFDVLTNFWGMLAAFVTGLAMMLGSYFGMKDVWLAWLDALEGGKLFKQEPAPAPAQRSRLESASAMEAVFSAEGWVKNNPNDRETVQFILSRFEKTRDRDWVISALMLSRGLTWQAAEQLVEAVLRAHGKLALPQRTFPPYAIVLMLGFTIAGLVVSLQYFAVTSVALRPAMAEVTNQYTLVRFLYQAGQYVEAAPAPFALSLLGLAVFIAGLLALRMMLPSVYRWSN
jgi:hypothetical protein